LLKDGLGLQHPTLLLLLVRRPGDTLSRGFVLLWVVWMVTLLVPVDGGGRAHYASPLSLLELREAGQHGTRVNNLVFSEYGIGLED
jgi:hypothetical protein